MKLHHRIERITPEDTSGMAQHLRRFRFPEGDFLADGFAPTGGCVWDFTIVRHEGRFHLIHIDGRPGVSCYAPGNLVTFGHSSTADFQHWTTHQPAIHAAPDAWDGGHVWAPYVFHDARVGCWAMLYAGLNRFDCEQIGLAYSEDLVVWTKEPANPVFRPTSVDWIKYTLSGGSSCRDPHILVDGDEYVLYATVSASDGRVGIMGASSKDLIGWSAPWPVYLTTMGPTVPRQVESSAVHRAGDRWLLFYTQSAGTHIVTGDNPRDFMGGSPHLAWPTIAAVEVVAKRHGEWLVAGYRLADNRGSFRLFFGRLDLASLDVTEISRAQEIAPYLEPGVETP